MEAADSLSSKLDEIDALLVESTRSNLKKSSTSRRKQGFSRGAPLPLDGTKPPCSPRISLDEGHDESTWARRVLSQAPVTVKSSSGISVPPASVHGGQSATNPDICDIAQEAAGKAAATVTSEPQSAEPRHTTYADELGHVNLDESLSEGLGCTTGAKTLEDFIGEARDAQSAGDATRTSHICLDGIHHFGEEPTLVQIFKESCADLCVTPSIQSYPSRVVLLTATRLSVGDDLPISYRITRARGQSKTATPALAPAEEEGATETAGVGSWGCLELHTANHEVDTKLEALMRGRPPDMDALGPSEASSSFEEIDALTRLKTGPALVHAALVCRPMTPHA